MNTFRFGLIVPLCLAVISSLSSCEKKEDPIVLPAKGAATVDRVEMGEDYKTQIFYDFETGKIVQTSEASCWDIAFEASKEGYHVFMNGGKGVLIYPTNKTSFADVNSSTVDTSGVGTDNNWKFDDPSGAATMTGVGEWKDQSGNSQNLVYVVYTATEGYHKMRLLSVDDGKYTIEYGQLDATNATVISMLKDYNYNFIYFSFTNAQHVIKPEPPKADWDIVFTRYRYIYKNLQNFKYIVTGALLNPYSTTAVDDTTHGFSGINIATATGLQFYADRDVIGFDWKYFDFNTPGSSYVVYPNHCYMIKNRKDHVWKLHFLDFKSPTAIKGSPLFEFERLY